MINAHSIRYGVVELKWVRRRPKKGFPPTRRMLACRDPQLLNSEQGIQTLNFRPTTNPPIYNPIPRGLIIVWDIMMQDYRAVPRDATVINQVRRRDFWKYFNTNIAGMSSRQKLAFMNS